MANKREAPPDFLAADLLKKPKKPAACRICHARKVKCSGEKPCTNCIKSDCASRCNYPTRDQKITINQSYIEQLLAENERLRGANQHGTDNLAAGGSISDVDIDIAATVLDSDASRRNPLLGEKSWFVSVSASGTPIHIDEAADAAFATRVRQALAESAHTAHIPRTQYVSDSKLIEFSHLDCPWPSQARARLLIKLAVANIGRRYHFIQEGVVLTSLAHLYSSLPVPSTAFTCKLWGLFALGEVYFAKAQRAPGSDFPGLLYFARACRILQCIGERPQKDTVETLLLLALYSLFINRRHNAYLWASSAVKICLIMGLHKNIPPNLLSDAGVRLNLKRVWWASYTIERTIASSLGQPASVQDEDVEVDVLSLADLSETTISDCTDIPYINENIRLARLSRTIIASIYSRRPMHDPFSLRHAKPASGRVRTLHLTFNQCVILATRPILLHIFRVNKEQWTDSAFDSRKEISETALALAEACIRCARHSTRLLTESWIDGTFSTFDQFDTRYLFSAATVLAISSLTIGRHDDSDRDGFEAACDFLEQLKQNGNFAATECCVQLHQIKLHIQTFRIKNGIAADTVRPDVSLLQSRGETFEATMLSGMADGMTAGMALAEPLMQDFLSQADLDLDFLDTQMQEHQFQSLYWSMAATEP